MKKFLMFLLFAVFFAGGLFAGGQQDAAGSEKGETLVVGVKSESSNVASWRLRSGQERIFFGAIYEGLFRLDKSGDVTPYLAESLDSNYEDLTYTVKLRDDVRFSDGSRLNADVLIWNFEIFKENSQYSSSEFGMVESFEKIDDYTVVIHLNRWTSQMPFSLTRNAGLMYSKKAFDEHGYDWCLQNPVGTGPYLIEKWVNDEYKSYVKNPDYWNTEETPFYDKLKIVIIGDEAAAQNALMSGEIDAYHGFSSASQSAMMERGGYNRQTNDLRYNSYIVVFASDVDDSPLSDLRVRQAICHAIDSQIISDKLGHGMTISNNQYAIPGTKFYNDDIKGYPYDPEKARELLAEAGYSDGFKTTMYTGNDIDVKTGWSPCRVT